MLKPLSSVLNDVLKSQTREMIRLLLVFWCYKLNNFLIDDQIIQQIELIN